MAYVKGLVEGPLYKHDHGYKIPPWKNKKFQILYKTSQTKIIIVTKANSMGAKAEVEVGEDKMMPHVVNVVN